MAATNCCPRSSPLTFASATSRSSATAATAISFSSLNSGRLLNGFRAARTPTRRRSLPVQRLLVRSGAVPVTQDEFPEVVLKSDIPVLVEFVADWCGPCRLISPVIEWASEEYKDRVKVVKIDHDANPELIKEYKIYGLPGLILFRDGREVPESRREGAITKAKLREYLENLLDSAVA